MTFNIYQSGNNFKIRYANGSFLINNSDIVTPTPTPTKTPTPSVTRTLTPTPSITISSTLTPTPTITTTTTVTPTATITPTITTTTTISPTPSITASLTPTVSITPTINGSFKSSNTANYNNCASWDSLTGNVTTVGSNGISSNYGTYDMNGNTWEWTERLWDTARGLKGGSWNSDGSRLNRSFEGYQAPTFTSNLVGFRVASLSSSPLFDYVTIGDANNANDNAGIGAVSYEFKIARFLVTNNDYAEFLNAIAVTDTYGVCDISMGDIRAGIIRSGSNGSYIYSTKTNYGNKPIIFVNWYNAARYCNWLHNGKPSGLQNNSTTENGAYQLSGNTGLPSREIGAQYFIPNGNEWQKAAFYKTGGINAGYWTYATRSDTLPTCISANSIGDGTL